MLQGHYQESIALLDADVPLVLRGSDVEAWQHLTQSASYGWLSQFDRARFHLAAAKKIIDSSQQQLLGQLSLRRGSLEFLSGNTEKAYAGYKETRDIAVRSRDPFLESAALGSLGLAATQLEHYDEALDWNKSALELSRATGAINSIARVEGNVGWSYHELGDLPNALEQFQLAEADAQKAGLAADRAYWLLSAGTVEFDLGNFRSSETKISQALDLADRLHDSSTVRECFENLGLVAMQNGQFVLARDRVARARSFDVTNPDPKRVQYEKLLSAQLSFRENKLAAAVGLLTELASDTHAPTSLRWEALATLAQVHAAQHRGALAEQEFSQAIATISRARDSVEREDFRLSFLSSAIRFYDEYISFLLAQNRPLDALKTADLSRAQTLERGLSSRLSGTPVRASSFNPKEIARVQHATLLFYWLGQQRSYLWVVTPEKVSLLSIPPGPDLNALAQSYRLSFLDPRDPLDSLAGDGQKLYDVLIRPAQPLIPRNSRVIVFPDGQLNGLNFDTLIVNEPVPHYWIEDVAISVGTSLALLSRSTQMQPPKSPNLLFFGDALPASRDFPSLADAGKELAVLEPLFPASRRTVFTKANAVRSNYLSSKPRQYNFLHFATHGIASTAHPLESAIILSPEADQYKLYARDIVQLPLTAYLVSISACNGAGEREFAGEGLVGLSWAFLRAGAHNVVAGLWEVSTASAPQIMDDLYKGVTAGQDPATALRNAKLNLVHSKGPYRRPFYWAPFQLYSGS